MAWPKPRNRKSPGPLVTAGNRGGEAGETRSLAGRPPAHDPSQDPQGGREPWKLRARRGGREAHPATQPNPPVHGPGEPGPGPSADPDPPGSPVVSGGAGPSGEPEGPPPWPGQPETSEASFWDWGRADDSSVPGDQGEGSPDSPVGEARDAAPARPSREPVITPVGATLRPEPGPEGIGQRLGNLAHLSRNPRMRTWQWRAVAAVIVGGAFTVLVSWQLGLTLAVLVVIADTIYRSRKVITAPGVRVTSAQRKTRRQLAKMERAGYRALHNGLIPDSEEQIDHLVVGPAGVFAIDSEAWDKRMPVRTRNARQIWHGPVSKKERLEHARWESQRAGEMLSGALGRPVTVRPAMAVYGPKIPWDIATIRDVDVFSGPKVKRYLRRRARHEGVKPLGDGEIERIYSAARTVFPEPAPR